MPETGPEAQESFVLRGDIAYSKDPETLVPYEDAYVVCVDGVSRGVFKTLPDDYRDLPVEDYSGRLILPGFSDLHVHAPQYQYRGNGMDLTLLDWLDQYAFPEEEKYSDLSYAERAYDLFVEDLYVGATTRACIFATIDPDATLGLMDMLEETGLITCVGKVNMDRNAPETYVETTEESLADTQAFLEAVAESGYLRTFPILTPRFTPSCTRELMDGLGRLAKEYGLPVQSHLSENKPEIAWVKELEPDAAFYGATYDRSGLFGENGKCIMAHCVHSVDEEVALIKERGVFIAHCPECNLNISSGVAPVRRYLEEGLRVGLGSDVAGGSTTSLFAAMRYAIIASKVRAMFINENDRPLTFPEVFYLATKGGGAFFGRVGSFEEGYEFDAVVIDDEALPTMREEQTLTERVERLLYLADDRHVTGKYVAGRKLY